MKSEVDKEFLARLKKALGEESARSFALRVGLSPSGFNQYMLGKSEPTRRILIAIADAAGVSVDWLATGRGQMRNVAPESVAQNADPELMGRLVDGIRKLYQELGIPVQDIAVGRWAAERHNVIIAEATDEAEQRAMIKMAVAELRKVLTAPNANNPDSKRQVSGT